MDVSCVLNEMTLHNVAVVCVAEMWLVTRGIEGIKICSSTKCVTASFLL